MGDVALVKKTNSLSTALGSPTSKSYSYSLYFIECDLIARAIVKLRGPW